MAWFGIDFFHQNKDWNWLECKFDSYFIEQKTYETVFNFDFELSFNSVERKRSIYNGLDFLGDVGGLLDGLTAVGSLLMTFFCFLFGNPLDSYLLKSLFKTEHGETIP